MDRILRFRKADWDRAKRTIPLHLKDDIVPETLGKYVIVSYGTRDAYYWIVANLGEPILLNSTLDIREYQRGLTHEQNRKRFTRKETD